MRYKIVLYNAGKRVKCFGTFDKYSEANRIYQLNLATNKVLFPKLSAWGGKETDFELLLLGPPEGKHIDHTRDEYGRRIALKASEGHTIKKLSPYLIEETFVWKNKKKKVQFKDLVRECIVKKSGIKTFHTVKNKLVIEYLSNDQLDVFVLKTQDDAVRLNDTIREFCHANEIHSNMYFAYLSAEARKLMYDLVEDRLGIPRKYMSRESTR
jgi:hypothetical protein